MKNLPSSFDLFFDIKTKEQLLIYYKQLCQDKKLVEELCKNHKVSLKD